MNYQIFQPSEILKPYVKYFWALDGGDAPFSDSEKVLPDGCLELIFNYKSPFKRIYEEGHEEIQPLSFVHGQIKNCIEIVPLNKVGIVAARFHPYGIAPFVNQPVSELNNMAVSTHDLFRNTKEVEEKIFEERRVEKKIEIMESFLINQILTNDKPDFLVQHCVNTIIQSNGTIGVSNLTKAIKISERHLERKFTTAIGLSPKSLQRIIRFQNVLKLVQQKKFNSLAALSFDMGYYDQAHFTRDFRQFTGMNPLKFFSDNHILSDYFTNE